MNVRIVAVIALAALVAGGSTVFGAALAAEGHADTEAGTHVEEEGHAEEGVEPGGAEAAEAEEGEEEGNAVLKIASAFLIATGAAALVPLTVLGIRRRERQPVLERRAADWAPVIAALLSAAAAAIHFAVISEHWRVWWAEGAFFLVAAVVQLLWALAVVIRPNPRLYLVGIAGNAFLALTWVVSRTSGVPLGPEAGEPEPVGLVDAMATSYEIVAVAALVTLFLRPATVAGPRATRPLAVLSSVVGVLLVPLTALALLDLVAL